MALFLGGLPLNSVDLGFTFKKVCEKRSIARFDRITLCLFSFTLLMKFECKEVIDMSEMFGRAIPSHTTNPFFEEVVERNGVKI